MREREVVVIVGGGSVGISFLVQLVNETIAKRVAQQVEIVMFEPQKEAGPGYAYQRDYATNVLNTRADAMSAVHADRGHFLGWLDRNRDAWEPDFPGLAPAPDAFLPRSLFGRYLAATFTDTVARAQMADIAIRYVHDTVVDIVPCHDGNYYVDTRSAGAFHANRVVLCCGNLESTNFPALVGTPNFHNNPYPGEKFADCVPATASVCILGTNLSAIDTAISLIQGGHKGKIVCVSRNGRLPSVRGALNNPVTLRLLTHERIDAIMAANGGILRLADVAALIRSEFEACTGAALDVDAIMNMGAGAYDYLSTEIEQSATQQRFWQSVIYATNFIIDYIWHKLDLTEKRLFQSGMKALWFSYRVSFPLENARKILEYMRTDRMSVFGGFMDIKARPENGTFDLRIADGKTGFRSTIECDAVINATSYSTDVTQTDNTLVRSLLRRRLAQPNEFGGFALDFESGRLAGADRGVSRGISVLGSLATGTYFWTNAMDVNARLAAQQAARIASEIAAAAPRRPSRAIIAQTRPRPPLAVGVPEKWLTNQTAR